MDAPLTDEEETSLQAHLVACPPCRWTERGYLEERRILQSLSTVPPPRDLWARTSVALDREIAHNGEGGTGSHEGQAGVRAVTTAQAPSVLMVSSILVAALAVVAAGARLTTDERHDPTVAPAPQEGLIVEPGGSSQELAVVNVAADGDLTVYQASVGMACPQPVAECELDAVASQQVLDVPGHQHPRELSLHTGTRMMALLAENERGADSVSVVSLPPLQDGALSGAGPGPDGRWLTAANPRATHNAKATRGDPAFNDDMDGTAPPLRVLDDVRVTGAAPAWSPDGELLAFSAMPTDRSRGPDLYVWRSGESRARRLTSDHHSWFASWSGPRIVASRTAARPDGIAARTLVIDPTTGRERTVAIDGAWLPVVDPAGRFALSWRGTLAGTTHQPRPRTGSMYLVDWSSVDPYQSRTGPAIVPRAGARLRAPGDPDGESRSIRTTGAQQAATAVTDGWLEAVEPARNARLDPLVDWQVHWSEDGASFGYWIADAPGASWGQLVVLPIEPTGQIDQSAPILRPTLAQRSFTLGINRIAWVAPSEDRPDGELRVRTWGSQAATIRIRGIDIRNGTLAF